MITWREWLVIYAIGIISIVVILFVTSCATPTMPMPDADLSIYEDCQDVDCVVDAIDAIPADQRDCERPLWMEGYRMPPLRWLLEHGRMTITRWSDWRKVQIIMFGGAMGRAVLHKGRYGDFAGADVYYLEGENWHTLAHELMHVAGPCLDSWWPQLVIQRPRSGYTKAQQEIMDADGVSRWVDTSYYQNEDPFWHD